MDLSWRARGSQGSTDLSRPTSGSNVIDLSSAGVPQRVRFPRSSSAISRGSSGTSSISAPSSRDRYQGKQASGRNLSEVLRSRSSSADAHQVRSELESGGGYRSRTVSREDILQRYRPDAREVARERVRETRGTGRTGGPSDGRRTGQTDAERAANVRDSITARDKDRAANARDAIAQRDKGRAADAREALKTRDAQRAKAARAAYAEKNASRITKARDNYKRSVAASQVRAGSARNGGGRYNNGYRDGYQDGWYDGYYWGNYGYNWGYNWWWSWPSYGWGLWWNYYWYNGGYWYPGYRPSFYWYGFYGSPVIYQTIESGGGADVVYVYEEPQQGVFEEEALPEGEVVVDADWAGGAPPPADASNLNRAADYYLTMGDQAFQESRFGDAVHFYAKAVEFSPTDGILYLILADALFATGDYHYAAYALRRALELDPGLAESIVDKHAFYADGAEFDRQLAVLETYIEDHFLDDDARLVLAANYLFGGRPAAAVDLLENAFSREVAQSPSGAALLDAARRIQYAYSSRGN